MSSPNPSSRDLSLPERGMGVPAGSSNLGRNNNETSSRSNFSTSMARATMDGHYPNEGGPQQQQPHAAHRHSSIRLSTLNFFKTVFANRQADYHTDGMMNEGVVPATRRHRYWPGQQGNASDRLNNNDLYSNRSFGTQDPAGGEGGPPPQAAPASLWRRLAVPNERHVLFLDMLYSRCWKIIMIVLAAILLFGEPFRELFIPPAGDPAVDSVFCVCLVLFFVDMVLRIDAEPHYFALYCGCCCGRAGAGAGAAARAGQHRGNPGMRGIQSGRGYCCQLGSFLFWCDFVSTLTLLADISWINKSYFGERQFDIGLDSFGIPESGLEDLNPGIPVQLNASLLVAIAQTSRVARFIRSSQALKLSGRINWNLMCNMLNPAWWYHRYIQRGHRRRKSGSSSTKIEAYSSGELGSENASSAAAALRNSGNKSSAPRRMTWNNIGLGVVAIVKANADAEQKTGWQRFKGKCMRLLGRPYSNSIEFRRHYAAVRIQRAWRVVLEQRKSALEDAYSTELMGTDVAWRGRMSVRPGLNSSSDNAVEREMKKRSNRNLTKTSTLKNSAADLGLSAAANKRRSESQVGSAMRELTGQRVAVGIIIALFLTVLFTYVEKDTTRQATMVVLMNQTGNEAFAGKAIAAARSSSVPDMFSYTFANGNTTTFDVVENGKSPDELRPNERMRITVADSFNRTTVGLFSYRNEAREEALVELLSTLFVILVWFFGVTAFAGPVLILVVVPIERMTRLLAMLMTDPLGYQSTSRYKKFVDEENEILKNTRWTPEILKGMETSFLMSTITRIADLMKVGFGSAGVEIIRNNLEKGRSENTLILSSQGSTVSCIFLFCDIRAFTDCTECLQEEVFVFTNRIAAVVHSNCHSLGGSANKNVGDAFLLSWLLDDDSKKQSGGGGMGHDSFSSRTHTERGGESFTAKHHQADKALLTVVRICMALHYDDYYLEALSSAAREALIEKLKKRKGRIVQMGFGLHAGRAVQGAIGSQRKIDATYVSEAVEQAEFLESSTKKYKLKVLMSDSFHRLLHPNNRRRCRKVDQILIREDDEDDEEEEDLLNGEIMELFTFDMDIDALWTEENNTRKDTTLRGESDTASDGGSKRNQMGKMPRARRMSARRTNKEGFSSSGDDISETGSGFFAAINGNQGNNSTNHGGAETESGGGGGGPSKLVLPSGPALYNANVWTSEEMRKIRELYSDGLFFQKFMSGLQSFYSKDWDHARQCFAVILERFEDGPSRYFMNQIEKHDGKPPRDFLGYGTA